MRKKFLSLMLLGLLCSIGNVWGVTTFTYSGSSGYDAATGDGATRDNITIIFSGGSHSNSNGGYWNVSAQNTTITITSTSSNITKVEITHTDGSRSKAMSVTTGSGSITGTAGTDATLTYSYSSAENNIVLKYTESGARVTKIVVTTTSSGGSGGGEEESAPAVTFSPKTNSSSTTLDNCTAATPTTGYLVASTTINTYGDAGCAGSQSAKTDETQKLKIDDEYTAANYYEWTFTENNCSFAPTNVTMKFQAVSDLVQYTIVLTDGTTSKTTNFVQTTSTGGTLETLDWDITDGTRFAADKTIKLQLWAYKKNSGATAFRLGSPITISGTILPNTVSGTISAVGWSTFASEYPLDLSRAITNGSAYYASEASTGTVTLETAPSQVVPAGEGLMIKGTPNATFTINTSSSAGTAISGNLLKGQTTTGDVAASTSGKYHYVFGFSKTDATVFGFYNLASDTEVAAGKAYLETTSDLSPASAAGRIRIVEAGNNATSIEAVESNDQAVKFFENGQLLIKRDGVVYDLTGRVVR